MTVDGPGVAKSDGLSFGVLGPLEVLDGGRRINVSAGKLRAFLAALLVQANQPVSLDELAVRLWDEHVPRGARGTLQAHALRLRRLLGDRHREVLRTWSDGYRIEVTPEQLDLLRFRRFRAEARSAVRTGDLNAEAAFLGRALDEWRGRSLSDIPSDSLQWEVVPNSRRTSCSCSSAGWTSTWKPAAGGRSSASWCS